MERCHVTVLVVDAQEGVTDQEKRLLSLIIDRGRAIVLVVNKWDLVTGGSGRGDEYTRRLEEEIPFASFVPHVFTSALTGRNVRKVLQVVNRVHENLFRRIPTSELNRFYDEVVQRHPPQGGARVPKIRYLVQAQVNPPVILLFAGGKGRIPLNYERFLLRELRDRYDYAGVPVLLIRR
jgi:GTP-binding protein